jgi:hypothetical protein
VENHLPHDAALAGKVVIHSNSTAPSQSDIDEETVMVYCEKRRSSSAPCRLRCMKVCKKKNEENIQKEDVPMDLDMPMENQQTCLPTTPATFINLQSGQHCEVHPCEEREVAEWPASVEGANLDIKPIEWKAEEVHDQQKVPEEGEQDTETSQDWNESWVYWEALEARLAEERKKTMLEVERMWEHKFQPWAEYIQNLKSRNEALENQVLQLLQAVTLLTEVQQSREAKAAREYFGRQVHFAEGQPEEAVWKVNQKNTSQVNMVSNTLSSATSSGLQRSPALAVLQANLKVPKFDGDDRHWTEFEGTGGSTQHTR